MRNVGMLSRIAESLFWIGRYMERADDTARIIDAFLAGILEDPWVDEDEASRSLLAILGSALVLVAVALIIWKLPAPSLEDPEITRLRKARKRDQGQLEVYRGELEAARKDLKGLEEATVSLAKSEAVFPADLVGTYQRAAFSALPAGTLEQGRSLRSQEPPHIEFPAWVRRLAGFEE